MKDAGKHVEFLVNEVKKGLFDLEAKFDLLEDCAKAAASLSAEIEGNETDSKVYISDIRAPLS